MREIQFYLKEAEFTKQDEIGLERSLRTLEEIAVLVQSIPFVRVSDDELIRYWRKRTAGDIIADKFSTGCSDDGLVFVTLARRAGIPTAYVETLAESYLKNPKIPIEGHVFVDIYQNGVEVPYNPRYGATTKHGKTYLWLPNTLNERYREIARGLDFSQLYTDATNEPIELRTLIQIWNLAKTIRR